jgi:hypothetical protein
MEINCAESPNSKHCFHRYHGVWQGVDPPPVTCCHCGVQVTVSEASGHGPFADNKLEIHRKFHTNSVDDAE